MVLIFQIFMLSVDASPHRRVNPFSGHQHSGPITIKKMLKKRLCLWTIFS